MDNPEPRAQYLNMILRQISRTAFRIPRFQREFVWGERDVLELMSSIERRYPIGSILTWRVEQKDDYFSGYRVGPFPPADEGLSTFEVVLDGAQRLSSLYGCLRDPSARPEYRVAFDLERHDFVNTAAMELQPPTVVPMSALFDSREFLEVQSRLTKLNEADRYLDDALALYTTFQDYQLPVISLANAELEDVVEVFRRVNSSGTPLSATDFVRALTWRSNFDLEETIASLVERFQATALEGLGADYILKCLAVVSGLSVDSRDVLQLKERSARPQGLTAEVRQIGEALERVAEVLERLGIASIREVPYEAQRVLLFAIMHHRADVQFAELSHWFWRSTFAEEHQSKPESYVNRLVREVRDGRHSSALEVRKPVDPLLLASRSRRNGSAVTLGFDLLMRQRQARSLLSGRQLANGEGLHGHLFARADSARGGASGFDAASLANLVLLDAEDAREWRRLQGVETLGDIFHRVEEATGDAPAIWASQGIPEDALLSAPSALLEARSRLLLGTFSLA